MRIEDPTVTTIVRSLPDGNVHRGRHGSRPEGKVASTRGEVTPTAAARETNPADGPAVVTRFRSPATINALRRFADGLLSSVGEGRREEAETLIRELYALGEELAGDDDRPYGRSVEHEIKRLLNDPNLRKAILSPARAAVGEEPIEATGSPIGLPETVEPPGEPAGLNLSV